MHVTGRRDAAGGQMGTDDGRDAGTDAMPVEDRAYQLHCRGYSYRQIAHTLGIDKDTAQRYVRAIAKEVAPRRKQDLEQMREDGVKRLRAVEQAAWDQFAAYADIGALNTVTRCEEQIARLRGLYQNHIMDDGHGDIQITISRRQPTDGG